MRSLGRLVRLSGWVVAVAIVIAWSGTELRWFDRLIDEATVPVAAYTTDDVNVRAAPSLDGDILDVAAAGTQVTVLGTPAHGFRPVEFEGRKAWIAVDYLAFSDPNLTSFLPQPENAAAAPADEAMVPSGGEPAEPVDASGDGRAARPDAGHGDIAGSDNVLPDEVFPDAVASGERWIDVDRSTRTVTLYTGDTVMASYVGKLGRDPSADGFYSTAVGTFHVFTKHDGLTSTPFVEGVYMTEFVGFDPDRHNGFHSPIKDASGAVLPSQNPTTLGCVRLDESAARAVYEFAEIGMRVEVHD